MNLFNCFFMMYVNYIFKVMINVYLVQCGIIGIEKFDIGQIYIKKKLIFD